MPLGDRPIVDQPVSIVHNGELHVHYGRPLPKHLSQEFDWPNPDDHLGKSLYTLLACVWENLTDENKCEILEQIRALAGIKPLIKRDIPFVSNEMLKKDLDMESSIIYE